jgi:hypothetical protein
VSEGRNRPTGERYTSKVYEVPDLSVDALTTVGALLVRLDRELGGAVWCLGGPSGGGIRTESSAARQSAPAPVSGLGPTMNGLARSSSPFASIPYDTVANPARRVPKGITPMELRTKMSVPRDSYVESRRCSRRIISALGKLGSTLDRRVHYHRHQRRRQALGTGGYPIALGTGSGR